MSTTKSSGTNKILESVEDTNVDRKPVLGRPKKTKTKTEPVQKKKRRSNRTKRMTHRIKEYGEYMDVDKNPVKERSKKTKTETSGTCRVLESLLVSYCGLTSNDLGRRAVTFPDCFKICQ